MLSKCSSPAESDEMFGFPGRRGRATLCGEPTPTALPFRAGLSPSVFIYYAAAAFGGAMDLLSPAVSPLRRTSRGPAQSLHERLRSSREPPAHLRTPALLKGPAQVSSPDPSSVDASAITQRKSGYFSIWRFQPPCLDGSIRRRSSYFLSLSLSGTASLDGLTA